MKGYIANTHDDWFDFLAKKRFWEEVNFWNPSDYCAFRSEPESPFLFRLKPPRNAIHGRPWGQTPCNEHGNQASPPPKSR